MARAPLPSAGDLDPAALRDLLADLESGDVKACCANVYEQPAVRWLLGGELHPGGEQLTRRALEAAAIADGARLLDVASGAGDSALLAAAEFGYEVVGVDLGPEAVAGANRRAAEAGIAGRVRFEVGDAERLPFGDGSFDAVLCECALCTFPDKPAAVAEIRRVLTPGGTLILSDVVAHHDRLPAGLRGTMATIACVGSALTRDAYWDLLGAAGFEPVSSFDAKPEVARMAKRVRSRLRGAKIMGLDGLVPVDGGIAGAIELAGEAERAVDRDALGYAVLIAKLSG